MKLSASIVRPAAEEVPGWRGVLARSLPTGFGKKPATYHLPAVLDEVSTWAVGAPDGAWRQPNIRSLVADIDQAASECGPAAQAVIASCCGRIQAGLLALSHGVSASSVGQLAAATADAIETVRSAAFRAALWSDLVATAHTPQSSGDDLEVHPEVLSEAFAAASIDPGKRFSSLSNVLAPEEGAQRYDPAAAADDWTDAQRIAAGADTVTAPPSEGHCIVWIRYGDARIPNPVTTLGRVTLFDADWCIPNALNDDGQDFDHRDEFKTTLDSDRQLSRYDPTELRQYDVLARIDLGRRSAFAAIDEAYRVMAAFIGTITTLTGAPAWTRGGYASVRIDGIRSYSQHGGSGRRMRSEPDHYGQNGFAETLGENQLSLSRLLSVDLPADVSEALRLIGEAEQVDSRENALQRIATITDRSVIVLRMSALERIAAFGNVDHRRLHEDVTAYWPLGRYLSSVQYAVQTATSELGGGDRLFHDLHPGRHGIEGSMDLKVAFGHRAEITAMLRHPEDAERCRWLLDSLGDSVAATVIIEGHRQECVRIRERLIRCRNALVHGNPVSDNAVNSVKPLAQYMVHGALGDLVESLGSSTPLSTVLSAGRASTDALLTRLQTGVPVFELWSENETG